MLSLTQTQDEVLAYVRAQMAPLPIVEQAIPDIDTVTRNAAGDIDPYIAVQIGDLAERGRKSMAGPLGDDYQQPFYWQVIAPDPTTGRLLNNELMGILLAAQFSYSGSMRKRAVGAILPIVGTNSATEAYLVPSSYSLLVQLVDLA